MQECQLWMNRNKNPCNMFPLCFLEGYSFAKVTVPSGNWPTLSPTFGLRMLCHWWPDMWTVRVALESKEIPISRRARLTRLGYLSGTVDQQWKKLTQHGVYGFASSWSKDTHSLSESMFLFLPISLSLCLFLSISIVAAFILYIVPKPGIYILSPTEHDSQGSERP